MSVEIDGAMFGMKGKFKKVSSSPTILPPCQHLVLPPSGIFKKSSVAIHGKEDGAITHEKFEV